MERSKDTKEKVGAKLLPDFKGTEFTNQSGSLGAPLLQGSNETQALLTRYSNPRTVVGTACALSPKAAGNRLHCKIICGDNKVFKNEKELEIILQKVPR